MVYFIFITLVLMLFWLGITVGYSKNYIIKFDTNILAYFHQIQSRILDLFFETITWLGSLWVLFPLYIAFMIALFKNGYKNILTINMIFFGAIGTTYIIKYLMDRKRPDIFNTIGDLPIDPSFPSAHTTQITIFSLLLVFLLFEYNLSHKLFYILGIFMIFSFVVSSRIYLQVHFFSDILGGVLVAIIWFLIGLKLMGRV